MDFLAHVDMELTSADGEGNSGGSEGALKEYLENVSREEDNIHRDLIFGKLNTVHHEDLMAAVERVKAHIRKRILQAVLRRATAIDPPGNPTSNEASIVGTVRALYLDGYIDREQFMNFPWPPLLGPREVVPNHV